MDMEAILDEAFTTAIAARHGGQIGSKIYKAIPGPYLRRGEKTLRDLAKAAAEGMTLRQAAKHIGRRYNYVTLIAKRNGIRFKREDRAKSDRVAKRNARIIGRAKAGDLAKTIAYDFGLSESSVTQIMRAAGLRRNKTKHD